MKILVTGGAGFIGSHLVARLVSDGHDVTVLDNLLRGNKLEKNVEAQILFEEGDVRDLETVNALSRNCDIIYHLAAYLGVDMVAENPVATMETEIFGTNNVANCAVSNGVEKLIYISTSGIYGKVAFEDAVNEDYMASPSSSYAIAKRYNEIYLKSMFQEHNLQSCSLRYFNVYGPRQDTRMVIPRFFDQAISGKPLSVFGSGSQTRDFTYIGETIESTVLVAEAFTDCEVINISKGADTSIYELAAKITSLVGSASQIKKISPPDGRYDFEVQKRRGNSDKLEDLTGYRPSMALEDGLKATYDYIRDNNI